MRVSKKIILFSFIFQIESVFGLQALYIAASPVYISPMQNEGLMQIYKMRPPAMRDKLQGNILYFNILCWACSLKTYSVHRTPRLHLGLIYTRLAGCTSNL